MEAAGKVGLQAGMSEEELELLERLQDSLSIDQLPGQSSRIKRNSN